MSKVIFDKDGRIGRISLNRPEKLNAIDDDVPGLLQDAVLVAEHDPNTVSYTHLTLPTT